MRTFYPLMGTQKPVYRELPTKSRILYPPSRSGNAPTEYWTVPAGLGVIPPRARPHGIPVWVGVGSSPGCRADIQARASPRLQRLPAPEVGPSVGAISERTPAFVFGGELVCACVLCSPPAQSLKKARAPRPRFPQEFRPYRFTLTRSYPYTRGTPYLLLSLGLDNGLRSHHRTKLPYLITFKRILTQVMIDKRIVVRPIRGF